MDLYVVTYYCPDEDPELIGICSSLDKAIRKATDWYADISDTDPTVPLGFDTLIGGWQAELSSDSGIGIEKVVLDA